MIRFCNLYSGSSGNSTFIETKNTKILVDAGVSCTKITKALESIGVSILDINGILISHEHVDHVRGIEVICKKYNIPVYATKKTWNALSKYIISNDLKLNFIPDNEFYIGDFLISPFSIPHDAAEPCAFNIFSENKKITIATDLGHVDDDLIKKMYASDILLIESNYDKDTLICGNYPYMLKKRIQSDIGHLSNDITGETVKKLHENGVNNIILGHLSKENNFPELAYQTCLNELNTCCCSIPFSLSVAKRDEIDTVITL